MREPRRPSRLTASLLRIQFKRLVWLATVGHPAKIAHVDLLAAIRRAMKK
jgi:hypothetical protein